MNHNNDGYYYWGMHMGWWGLIFVVVVLIAVWFNSARKRK
jgi:hypothetical protein